MLSRNQLLLKLANLLNGKILGDSSDSHQIEEVQIGEDLIKFKLVGADGQAQWYSLALNHA
jgi:hypothetical protein